MKSSLLACIRSGLLLLLWWQTSGLIFGQAGIPETTPPGGGTGTSPSGPSLPGSSTATSWLRLNGNIGINTSDPRSSLHVSQGDVYIDKINSGVIMRSPNGFCWRVTVDNTGNLVRQRIACPGAAPLTSEVLTVQPGPTEGQDGYTSTYQPRNVGGGGGMAIGSWTTEGNATLFQSYLRFDLSSVPATAKIDSAFLTLTYYPGWFSAPNVGNNAAYLQRVTSVWDQTTLTLETRPSSTTVGQIAIPAAESRPTIYQKVNVTSAIADMVANPATNFGFLLRLQDEAPAPPYRLLLFATSENPTPANRPRLVIYYNQ